MATLEQLSAALVKADAAGNTEDAKVLADAIRKMRAAAPEQPKAAPEQPSEIPAQRNTASATGSLLPSAQTLGEIGQGAINLIAGGLRGAGSIGATFARPFETAEENAARRRRLDENAARFLGAEPESAMYSVGKFAGEVAGTAGVGGFLAAPVKAAASFAPRLAPVATALETGGLVAKVPSKLGTAGLRLGTGAATGAAATGLIDPTRSSIETGAAFGAAVPIVAPVAGILGGKILDIGRGTNQLAAQIARESLGSPEQVAAARNALQKAQREGLDLTAQQALARGGVIAPSTQSTIERAIKTTGVVDTRAVKEAAQEAARKSTIIGITPDMQSAVNARRAASQPLYEAADKAVVAIDQDLDTLFARMPTGTLSKAAEIAKMEGRPFIMGETKAAQMVPTGVLDASGNPMVRQVAGTEATITGESLHYIKRALSDIAHAPPATTGMGRDTQLAARGLLDDFVRTFETKVPEYGQARRLYSDLSAPVNQAQVLKEMLSVLEKPGGGERITPFLNILGRGENAMLKRAGGRGAPRYEALTDVLTPEQISKVREIARQLETETTIGRQVADAGQLRAAELIKDELPNYRLPSWFNIFATTANKFLEIIGARTSKETIKKLADASLSAQSFDELLATLPAKERNKVLQVISDPKTWVNVPSVTQEKVKKLGGVVTGTTATTVAEEPRNNLAPVTNQNALAR
jgi:hypothetical protein